MLPGQIFRRGLKAVLVLLLHCVEEVLDNIVCFGIKQSLIVVSFDEISLHFRNSFSYIVCVGVLPAPSATHLAFGLFRDEWLS